MSTLFAYFGKSPKVTKTPDQNANIENKVSKEIPTLNGTPKSSFTSNSSSNLTEEGSIIWAKLGDHPWWPSMVCRHPTVKRCTRKDDVHVQFLGNPPSRSWVKQRNVCDIKEDHGGDTEDLKEAYQQAKGALNLTKKERIDNLYACVASDEEMDDRDIDGGDIDGAVDGEVVTQNNRKRSRADYSSDDDDVQGVQRSKSRKTPRRKSAMNGDKRLKKRAKWTIGSGSEDSNDEDNYKPSGSEESEDDASSGVEENEEESCSSALSAESDDGDKKALARKRKTTGSSSSKCSAKTPKTNGKSSPLLATPVTPKTSALSSKLSNSVSKAQASLAKFSATNSPASSRDTAIQDEELFRHQKLAFLKDGNRKDKHGRLHTDPNYDKRTLLVPDSYINSKEVTPGMRQWWLLKRDNFDTILFFKVGKFYELYHMDACTGVKELGLLYMKGGFAHAGFPEIAFSRYSDLLIQKGYKVARVEQTETPQMMTERCATRTVKDKVVRREICAIISKGTKTYSFMEGDSTEYESSYLLAVCERGNDDSAMFPSCIGVCFVDTSLGKFHLGQFKDDQQCSRFRTLISHHKPAQVLFERNSLSSKMQHVLNHELTSCLKESLSPGSEFWDGKKTLKVMTESEYFNGTGKSSSASEEGPEKTQMPETLKRMLSDYDSLGLTPHDNYQLAVSALGACIWYLKRCCIDEELLSMGQFEEFIPLDSISKEQVSAGFPTKGQHLILDAVTLSNLDVVLNGDGSTEGTLIQQLDHCSTPFGKRLLKQWLCAPLCNPSGINDRLDAVDDLYNKPSLISESKEVLKTFPDLERLLRRIHSLGSLRRSKEHPDSRAILYNEDVYGKRKIGDLLAALEGFEKAMTVQDVFKSDATSFKSHLLQKVTVTESPNGTSVGRFPDLKEKLKFFKAGFDHSKAKKDGVIIPGKGMHEAYDNAIRDIQQIKEEFDTYLSKQKKRLGCKTIVYWGTGKVRYQLEVPEAVLKHNTPDDYHLKSQKKGFKRYWTDEIEDTLKSLEDAEERRDSALKDTMRNIFNQFDKHRKTWEKAVECIAVLDCLLSLAYYRTNAEGILCRPEFVLPGEDFKPFMKILNSRHPCISRTFSGDDFIPNDIVVGAEDCHSSDESRRCVIVTGPNMGGKSTLMRQAGVLTIMAQLGSYVPAEKCEMTPCDRIFTRLGAHDRIMHGESTFFVELSETSSILQHATENSLVLLDELGRGTATYDGTAIASAVIKEISYSIRCRTLFSTHYHSLVDELSEDPRVKLGHMACMVETEDDCEDGEDPSKETITFLYRFTEGSCPKSYGFNAAKLAGIPISVITKASKKAKEFELTTKKSRLLRGLFTSPTSNDKDTVRDLLQTSGFLAG